MKNMLTLEKILSIPEETNEFECKRLGGTGGVVGNILKSIVAMANTDGGTVVLGVDDPEKTTLKGDERVFGIEENKENFDEVIRNVSKVIPPASVRIDEIKTSGEKTIAVLHVSKANDSFHSIDKKVFIRLNKGNKELTPHEIVQFSYAKGFTSATEDLVVTVSFDLLDTQYYRAWVEENTLDSNGKGIEYVLASKGLARKDEKIGVLKPTRAAVLLFAEYPTNLMDTKCAVKVVVYTGNEEIFGEVPNFVGVSKIIQGPAITVIRDTQEYVLQVLTAGVSNGGSGFRTDYKLPERAIREGITNAVIHRDYYIKMDIESRYFPIGLKLSIPGCFRLI